jgi:hypothetical protein
MNLVMSIAWKSTHELSKHEKDVESTGMRATIVSFAQAQHLWVSVVRTHAYAAIPS